MGMLRIGKREYQAMVRHLQRVYPMEGCGILAGRGGTVLRVYPLTNSARSEISFFVDPHEQLRVTQDIRRRKQEILAIFHSHVHEEAYPSEADRALAFYPEVDYVIVSLLDPAKPEVRSFRICNGAVDEEELRVEGAREVAR